MKKPESPDSMKSEDKPTQSVYEKYLEGFRKAGVKVVENKTGKISAFIGPGTKPKNAEKGKDEEES